MSARLSRRSRSRSPDSTRSGSRKHEDQLWLQSSSSSRSCSRSRSRSPQRRRNDRSKPRKSKSRSAVRPVASKEPRYMISRVFVGNLASDKISSLELEAHFEKHGRIIDVLVLKSYGFVQFANEEDARRAVDAENNALLGGKRIKLDMAAKGKRHRRGAEPGRGPGPGPDDRLNGSRMGRDMLDRSPLRDPYGPPPYVDPYLRGRDLPPSPPPRDPFFDDPYRRPLPPDLSHDRFRDDPYSLPRRDPYALDPYRDPYREPLYEPDVVPPKKPLAVDCEIIIIKAQLRDYAELLQRRLNNINLITSVVIRKDRTIQQQLEDATRRNCLFAIVINSQNELHRSLTLNILHGVPQAYQNMPLDDALALVARSFEKYLQDEKDKAVGSSRGAARKLPSVPFLPAPKEISYLLHLLADNRHLTVDELDKVISYLKERKAYQNMPLDDALALVARNFEKYLQDEKDKALGSSRGAARKLPSVPFLPAPKEISYLLHLLADNRHLTVVELDKVISYLKERKDKLLEAEGLPPVSSNNATVSPVSLYTLTQQHQTLQLLQEQQQELQNKVLCMMNGTTTTAGSRSLSSSRVPTSPTRHTFSSDRHTGSGRRHPSGRHSPPFASSFVSGFGLGSRSPAHSPARPSAHITPGPQLSRNMDEAARLISYILPPDVCPPSPPLKRTALALDDEHHQVKRFKSLPQPPRFRDLTEAFNADLRQGKSGESFFSRGRWWPEGVDVGYRQRWYTGHSQFFHFPYPALDIGAEMQAGGKQAAKKWMIPGLNQTATLIRDALACAGFLELATQAVIQCVEEESSHSSSSRFRDISTVAAAANRAAYHASTHSLAAAVNCDLMRRDSVLKSCTGMPLAVKAQLRQAPVGEPLLFGPTWQRVMESAKDLWPNAPKVDHTRFQSSRKAVGRALRNLRPASRPDAAGTSRSRKRPFFSRLRPARAAAAARLRRGRRPGRGRAQ